MYNRFKQILNRTKSVNSTNQDIKSNLNFISSYKELPYNDINEIVNAYEVFSKERNDSDKYRFIGSIRLLTSNPLIDISGQDSLAMLDSTRFRNTNPLELNIDITDDGDYTFKESYNNYFNETDGWYSYINPSLETPNKCERIDFSPKRTAFELINNQQNNWYFYLTYPSKIDETHKLVNDGLLIVDAGTAKIGSIEKQYLVSAVKHNLNAGDKVRLSGIGNFNGDYTVKRLGMDNGKLRDYTFVIDLPANSINVGTGIELRMKKIYLGEESKYYFRIFTPITETKDYELYNLAYSTTIFGDKVGQIIFNGDKNGNSDVKIGGLKDNLGRPISEMYFTAIKGKKYGDKSFSKIKSGINIPLIGGITDYKDVPDIRRIHNVSSHVPESHIPLETDIDDFNSSFYGDVVEYNRLYLKETVLAEVNHRFNTINRDSKEKIYLENTGNFDMGPRPEGYMYKPHHKITIKQFSSYIEQGDETTYNIPDYATPIGNNRYIWRDILPLGFNDGSHENTLDYPFTNGAHYIYSNILLNVRRQDPFNQYGLYYNKFPRDPHGDVLNTNNIDENIGDYVC